MSYITGIATKWIAIAAVVVLVLGTCAWWAFHPGGGASTHTRATLTRTSGGNTLNNPRGSTVADVVLSDGTHVWLNAGSTLHYPDVFPSGDRTVDVTGEAYFEVASDTRRPLHIRRDRVAVITTGGAFDIRAYGDEPLLRVTAVDGRARVGSDNELALESGEQAVVTGRAERVKDVHTEAVTAWKDGLFYFSHTDLVSAMRELSRWYGVEVIYGKDLSDKYFTGKLDRSLSLAEVLKTLTEERIHYSIDPDKHQVKIGD